MSAGVLAALFALATITAAIAVMIMVACRASTRALSIGACIAVALAACMLVFRISAL